MAWNQPDKKIEEPRKRESKLFSFSYIFSFCIVVILSVGLYVAIFNSNKDFSQEKDNKPRSEIRKEEKKGVSQSETNVAERETLQVAKLTQQSEPVDNALDMTSYSYSAAEAVNLAKERGIRPLFKHQSDVWLSQFVTPGIRIPPVPMSGFTSQDFANSLLDPIVFDEEDSARDREIKQAVIDMRKEASQWIKNGGDFDGYLKELENRQNREADFVEGARSILIQDFREHGDFNEAIAAWRLINTKLESEGLRKIKLPAPIRIQMARNGMKIPEE